MGREENVSIFEDTKKMVKNNKTLAEAVKWFLYAPQKCTGSDSQ